MDKEKEVIDILKDISSMKTSIENIEKNTGEIKNSLFGAGGIEKRLRKVEIKQACLGTITTAIFGIKAMFFGK